MNGTLYKYTNFAKGWQRRYFVLDGSTLHYYLREPIDGQPSGKQRGKARGSLPIVGAMITPSDEDGHGFTVSASNGDIYKLKASDARNRQMWVDHLRSSSGGALLPHPEISTQGGMSDSLMSEAPTVKIYDQLVNARDSCAAARKHLMEIEDKCDQLPMNELYLKLMSYGHSAIVSLERAVDIADRTYLFGKTEQLRTNQLDIEKDVSQRSISIEKGNSSSSEAEDETKDEWVKTTFLQDDEMVEFDDEQRANMVSIMQQIQYGGSLLTQSWPQWLMSSHTGSELLGQLCRNCPESSDSLELIKWILSVKIPPYIFFNRIPRPSLKLFECKFDNSLIVIENLSPNKFKVTIEAGVTTSFQVSFESVFRGPGKPFLIETKIKNFSIGEQVWHIAETPLIKVQHALSAPKLTWHGRWLVKNRDLKEEIQINYAGDEVSGHLRDETKMVSVDGSIHRPRLDGEFFKLSEPAYYIRQ